MEVILYLILSVGGTLDMQEQGAYESHAQCRAYGEQYMRSHPDKVTGYICRNGGVSAEHQSK